MSSTQAEETLHSPAPSELSTPLYTGTSRIISTTYFSNVFLLQSDMAQVLLNVGALTRQELLKCHCPGSPGNEHSPKATRAFGQCSQAQDWIVEVSVQG